jgi:transposase
MTIALGIDIAKATYAECLRNADGKRRHKSFSNTPAGHDAVRDWLARHAPAPVHACLEATGTYGEAVATVLADAGHRVSLVNPAAVKAFAQSQLRRTKTDQVDADVLADFCVAHHPPAWTPWPPGSARLRHAHKHKMVVVGAAMRKLLHIVYGVLKHQRAFDPTIAGA